MKKFFLTQKAYFLCLISIGMLIGSCQIDKIKDDLSPDTLAELQYSTADDIPFAGVCQFQIGGLVIDSKTCLAIEDAKIEFTYEDQTTMEILTNNEGEFIFNTMFDSSLDSVEVNITKDGYTLSRFILRAEDYFDVENCRGNTCYFTSVDFFLTPQQPIRQITALWGEWTIEDETKLLVDGEEGENCIINYHINIPENSVIDPLDLLFTPLDIRQYFCGMIPKEPIVAVFEAKPAPFKFEIPLELDFTPPRDMPSDVILNCYYFDEETNTWIKDEDAVLDYRFGKVYLAIEKLACVHMITYTIPYFVGDTTRIEIVDDELGVGDDILDIYTIGNCDCNMMKVDTVNTLFERDRDLESLKFPYQEISEKEMELFLNDLRRQFCIPAKTLADLSYEYDVVKGTEISLNTKVKVKLKPFFLQECDNFEIYVINTKRFIRGSYENKYFEYEVVVRTDFRKIKIDCPTTSGCHQGCGD